MFAGCSCVNVRFYGRAQDALPDEHAFALLTKVFVLIAEVERGLAGYINVRQQGRWWPTIYWEVAIRPTCGNMGIPEGTHAAISFCVKPTTPVLGDKPEGYDDLPEVLSDHNDGDIWLNPLDPNRADAVNHISSDGRGMKHLLESQADSAAMIKKVRGDLARYITVA